MDGNYNQHPAAPAQQQQYQNYNPSQGEYIAPQGEYMSAPQHQQQALSPQGYLPQQQQGCHMQPDYLQTSQAYSHPVQQHTPPAFGQRTPQQSGDETSPSHSRSPLAAGIEFFKGLSSKKTTKDGQEPKRRGPKPDSKPALTRRQELNRQAQRSHRERKELYIKALEQEVERVREVINQMAKDKAELSEENRKLKEMLRLHGLLQDFESLPVTTNANTNQTINTTAAGVDHSNYSSSMGGDTLLGTNSPAYLESHHSGSDFSGHTRSVSMGGTQNDYGVVQQQHTPVVMPTGRPQGSEQSYDEVGIDFVLTLERPCTAHIPILIERALKEEDEITGHALMASYPSTAYFQDPPPLGRSVADCNPVLDPADLATLLEASQRLDLDGQITPVMAWAMILAHPRFSELDNLDFKMLTDDLSKKVACHGFGAVMEDFEVRDALAMVLSTRG